MTRPVIVGRSYGSAYSAMFCGPTSLTFPSKTSYTHTLKPGCSGCRADPVDHEVVIDGSGLYLADVRGGHDGFAISRYRPAGNKLLWAKSISVANTGIQARGAATLGDATNVVVGAAGAINGPYTKGFIARIGEAGQLLWEKSIAFAEPWMFVDAVEAVGGNIVAGGYRAVNNTVKRRLLVGIDKNSKIAWQIKPTLQSSYTTVDVMTAGHGSDVVWFGTKHYGAKRDIVAGAVDNSGNELWASTVRVASAHSLRPHLVNRLAGGGFALTLYRVANGKPDLQLLRLSSWGHPTCVTARGCFAPAKQCDDGKPCTADFCDPSSGCKHTPIKGATCDK